MENWSDGKARKSFFATLQYSISPSLPLGVSKLYASLSEQSAMKSQSWWNKTFPLAVRIKVIDLRIAISRGGFNS
jgi:hypothetical protein